MGGIVNPFMSWDRVGEEIFSTALRGRRATIPRDTGTPFHRGQGLRPVNATLTEVQATLLGNVQPIGLVPMMHLGCLIVLQT